MTVIVKDASKSVLSGLSKMKAAMIADYADFMPPTKSDTTAKMNVIMLTILTFGTVKSTSRLSVTIVLLRLSLVLTTTRSSRRVTF